MPVDAQDNEQTIWCHSIFGARTLKGLVGLTVGDRKPVYMSPAEARSVAADLLQSATAAEMDETLVKFLTIDKAASIESAVQMLRDLRNTRDRLFPPLSQPPQTVESDQ